MRTMQLRDAKAQFSSVVEAASKGEASLVTRHGEPAAVILGYEEWQRLSRRVPSFVEHLLAFPIDDGDEIFERDRTPMRDIEF